MLPSVLGNLTLGYQLVWNRLRQPAAVQLFVDLRPHASVDAAHLLAALERAWSEQSPVLLLCVQNADLLLDLLRHAPPDGPWIVVQEQQLADPLLAEQVREAHLRGVPVWSRNAPGQAAGAADGAGVKRSITSLTAAQALSALRVALHQVRAGAGAPAGALKSPVAAGHVYESVASRMLAEHCLDQQGAWGVAGWPMEDVLHGYRQQQIQPGERAIVKLVEATDADAAMEIIEHGLAEEPVLAYRFLRFANSAAFGQRVGIDSLRHGLMVLGLSTFRNWLLEQLPHATSDLNLQPVRTAMVVRARLMEQLLDAGDEDKLRREVFLCGLLSQIDLVLGEPMAAVLQKIPVSERITEAILHDAGPYAPFLAMATALEYPNTGTLPELCDNHAIEPADVNRALLRVLAHAHTRPAKGRLLD